MFQKLAKGEYSLGASFWKFGVLGLVFVYIVLYIIERVLYNSLGGMDLFTYYFRRAGFLQANVSILILTGMHLVSLVLYAVYSLMVFLGVWRSSREYEKSSVLATLARIFIILIILFGLKYAF